MGRRRKAVEVEADSDTNDQGAAVKKIKNELDVDGYCIQWEWENDSGKWTAYNCDDGEEITTAYNKGSKDVTLDVAVGVQMKIIFDKMVQKNKKTGWERRMRCGLRSDSSADPYVWVWQDEYKRWNPYSLRTSLDLERSYNGSKEDVKSEAAKRSYTIDLNAMKQKNDSTGVLRSVDRIQSDVVPELTTGGASGSKKKASGRRATSGGGDDGAVASASKVKAEVKTEVKPEVKTEAKASSGRKGKSQGKKGSGSGEGDGTPTVTLKTVVMKGKAPVDPECTAKIHVAHVYSEGNNVYDAMLNQTNLSNNNNKYYLMQILQDDNKKSFSVWLRWGRVGFKGQTNLIPCGPDLDEAKKLFCKKFSDKTKNDWSGRKKFCKVPGKYDLVEVDYKAETKEEEKKPKVKTPVPPSKLESRLQDLINLICDVKSMEDVVLEMKYDAQKAPLGKLTTSQIKAGYAALKEIDDCIAKGNLGSKLIQACNDFYTRIPHCFGMRQPPVIRTKMDVKQKLDLLEALGDIEIAMKIINESKADENPVDTHYSSLKCDLQALDHQDPDFKMVEDYLHNTHAATHNQYGMKLLDIFEVENEGEREKYKDYGQKMLLWHGSRLTNYVGILSQGLRIAPPEAPVTGYMFGKGIYFADMSSKSANYCYPTKAKNTGLVMLCEVSLGTTHDLLSADPDASDLPPGTHSVRGMGKLAPDPKKNFAMADGTTVPLGKPVNTGVNNPQGYTLNYNEFIVYDVKQIVMRYLCKVEFKFK